MQEMWTQEHKFNILGTMSLYDTQLASTGGFLILAAITIHAMLHTAARHVWK